MEAVKMATQYGIPFLIAGGALYMADDVVTRTLKDYKWPVVIAGAVGLTVFWTTNPMTKDMFKFPKS
jgi:hypothetical protein